MTVSKLREVLVKVKGKEIKGFFHIFSCYADENGSQPVAIIELTDGTIITPDPDRVRFMEVVNNVSNNQNQQP